MSDPSQAAGTVTPPKNTWQRWVERIESIKTLAFSLTILAAIGVAVPMLAKMVTTKGVIISDISVPSSLEDRGMSGTVVAQRILDHLHEISAGSKKEQSAITGSEDQSQLPDIQLPVGGGLDLNSLLSQVRNFLGYKDTKITGEITTDQIGDDDKGTPSTYLLRLRMAGQGMIYQSTKASDQVDSLIDEAAIEIMHRFDPINLGFYLYKKKDYVNAFRMTETAIANGAKGDDGWAFNMRGMIQRDQRHYPEAVAQFREAIRREPNFVYAYNNLSQTLRLMGQLDEAAEVARKAIELAPKGREGYSNLALVLIEQDKGDEAVALMQKAIAADPHNHHVHLDLGVILHKMKKMDAAAASLQKAAEIKPDHADIYVTLSGVLHVTGKYDEARALAQKAANLDPKSPMPWNLLGIYALERKDYPHAVTNFNKAVGIDKVFVDGYVNLGMALSSEKKYADAIAAFHKAADLDKTNADILVRWSDTLEVSGKSKEAAEKFVAAVAVSRNPASVYQHHGRMQEARGDFDGAVESYRKALAADPKLAGVLKGEITRVEQAKAAPPQAAPQPPERGRTRH
jgi:tetratricopeptide (TPR) repeat protein